MLLTYHSDINCDIFVGDRVAKIEIKTNRIDIGKKRIDGIRQLIIEVEEYEQNKLAPILMLEGDYTLKVVIEDDKS